MLLTYVFHKNINNKIVKILIHSYYIYFLSAVPLRYVKTALILGVSPRRTSSKLLWRWNVWRLSFSNGHSIKMCRPVCCASYWAHDGVCWLPNRRLWPTWTRARISSLRMAEEEGYHVCGVGFHISRLVIMCVYPLDRTVGRCTQN
jgi:hypothetical protein